MLLLVLLFMYSNNLIIQHVAYSIKNLIHQLFLFGWTVFFSTPAIAQVLANLIIAS